MRNNRFHRVKHAAAVSVVSAVLFANGLTAVSAIDGPSDTPRYPGWTDPTEEDEALREEYLRQDQAVQAASRIDPDTRTLQITDYANASSGITRYWQDNYPNTKLCSSSTNTIQSAGCVVTSFAMDVSKYGITSTPPDVVYQINTYAPGTQTACSFPWASLPTISKYSSLSYYNLTDPGYLEAPSLATIRSCLSNGYPVIVYMQDFSGNSHGVLCVSYYHYNDGSYKHMIYNPSMYANKNTLEDYMATWYISGIHLYHN